jgi:hypothetical protein
VYTYIMRAHKHTHKQVPSSWITRGVHRMRRCCVIIAGKGQSIYISKEMSWDSHMLENNRISHIVWSYMITGKKAESWTQGNLFPKHFWPDRRWSLMPPHSFGLQLIPTNCFFLKKKKMESVCDADSSPSGFTLKVLVFHRTDTHI